MLGEMMLLSAAADARIAAKLYPQILRLMDDAGVPPDDRARILAYILQVIAADAGVCHVLQ